jgi:hypothetical protein
MTGEFGRRSAADDRSLSAPTRRELSSGSSGDAKSRSQLCSRPTVTRSSKGWAQARVPSSADAGWIPAASASWFRGPLRVPRPPLPRGATLVIRRPRAAQPSGSASSSSSTSSVYPCVVSDREWRINACRATTSRPLSRKSIGEGVTKGREGSHSRPLADAPNRPLEEVDPDRSNLGPCTRGGAGKAGRTPD